MPSLYLKAAAFWFAAAVALGLYMGAAQDFRFVHVHVHLNLLGWASQALMGLMLMAFPRIFSWRMALLQCGLYNLGLTVFMGGIAMAQLTQEKPFAAIAGGSLTVGAAVMVFAVQVFRHLPRTKAKA